MAKSSTKKKRYADGMEPTGQAGCYVICGAPYNRHKVLRADLVEGIQQAKRDEKSGELAKRHPRIKSPRYFIEVTRQMIDEAHEKALRPNPATGDFVTDSMEDAMIYYRSIKRINPNAYISPLSLPLPDDVLDGVPIPSNNR